MARKWLALAERRRAQLVELRSSDRWTRYFTQSELDAQLRELNLACNRFARLAGIEQATSGAGSVDSGGDVPPLHGDEMIARLGPLLESAVAAALSAAAELQEG